MLLCAVSCDNVKDPEDTSGSSPESVTNAPDASGKSDLVIASNGKTDFTVWIAQELYSNSSVKSKLDDVREQIKKKTDANISIKSDRSATDADKEKPGILVGHTSFAESDSVTVGRRVKDFAVARVGNKILLTAANTEGVLNAITSFYNKAVIGQKAENKTLFFKESHCYTSNYTYNIQSVLCGGTELMEYRIVIPQKATLNETYLANNLRYYLNLNYGYKFEIVTDDQTPTTNEILIGRTKRTTVQVSNGQYRVSVSDGKLQMVADGMRGYESLWAYLRGSLLSAGYGKTHTLDNGFTYTANATATLEDGTLFANERNGDVRVIFYNNLGYSESGAPVIRQPLQKELIETYAPDVLGLQEYTPAYHTNFTSVLTSMGYTVISTTGNYTPIFYKADKLEVVTTGYTVYDCPAPTDMSKGVTWAVFRVKKTGKLLAVFNTHFMYNRDDNNDGVKDDHTTSRVSNANEIMELIQSVQSQYAGISVVMGGDLNSQKGSSPHNVLTAGGMVHAWDKAETKNNTRGYHTYSTYDAEWKIYTEVPAISGACTAAIDHAYVSSNATVKSYASLCNDYALWTSDHMPVLVELELN